LHKTKTDIFGKCNLDANFRTIANPTDGSQIWIFSICCLQKQNRRSFILIGFTLMPSSNLSLGGDGSHALSAKFQEKKEMIMFRLQV